MPHCSLENEKRKAARLRLTIPLTFLQPAIYQQSIRPNHVFYSCSTTANNDQRYLFRKEHCLVLWKFAVLLNMIRSDCPLILSCILLSTFKNLFVLWMLKERGEVKSLPVNGKIMYLTNPAEHLTEMVLCRFSCQWILWSHVYWLTSDANQHSSVSYWLDLFCTCKYLIVSQGSNAFSL